MKKVTSQSLKLEPIGFIHTSQKLKFDSPHQPRPDKNEVNTIELSAGHNFEQALRDLDGFERVWIIWWFHKNSTWNPVVLPPRGPNKKRGVFATRSPHRPNPIGITSVPLLEIKGRKLKIGPVDLLDGTPILDIKPYLPEVDSFPRANIGWLSEVKDDLKRGGKFKISLSKTARMQAKWLKDQFDIDFISRAKEILSVDPSAHRTRRISKLNSGFKIGCGAWRAYFQVSGNKVNIQALAAGYPQSALNSAKYSSIPEREAQLAFLARWPAPGLGA